ncbi:MAG: IS1595 family transposase [Lentisphaeria bacterium]|nr:IS1595 family transposase [Lentisphaeria bacterium]
MSSPKSLPEFQRVFPNEDACRAYLYRARFPDGFLCSYCGDTGEPYRFRNRPDRLRCRSCKRDAQLTASTIMQGSQLPLCTWFWGAFLVTSLTPGMSALQFQKMLGIGRYEPAFNMLHKLRAAMVRPQRDRIGGQWPVEVDETFVGGATQGEGRGRHHKTLVAGIVEVRPRKRAPGPDPNLPSGQRPQHRGGHGRGFIAGRLRLQVIPNRKQETLEPFVLANVKQRTEVRTDGWTGYDNLEKLGYLHKAVSLRGDHAMTDQHLPMIHIVFGNLDAWLLGTHHGVSPKHLQGYLNEFVFRFNRRFWPLVAFASVLRIGAQVEAPTYTALYDGSWEHPGGKAG